MSSEGGKLWKKGLPTDRGWYWIRRGKGQKEGLVWIDIVATRPVVFKDGPKSAGRFLAPCFKPEDKPEYAKGLAPGSKIGFDPWN